MKIDSHRGKCLSIPVTKDDICITEEMKEYQGGKSLKALVFCLFLVQKSITGNYNMIFVHLPSLDLIAGLMPVT